MHFTSILRHKHTSTQTPSPKPANAFAIMPLGIFTIVSVMPHNALTFESNLAHSPTPRLIAQVNIRRGTNPQLPISGLRSASPTASAIAPSNPITPTTPPPAPPAPVQPAVEPVPPAPVAPVATTEPSPPPAALAAAPAQPAVAAPAPAPATPPPAAPAPAAPAAPPGNATLVLEGEASFYSRAGCLGCSPALRMANGQPLNDNALTMAIGADRKHLVGRKARVTNLTTGKSVVVTITDTGGFYKARYGNRVADLTIATKQAIGMNGGVGQVRVEVF